MSADEAIYALYRAEYHAYCEWQAERAGDPVRPNDLKNRNISPKRVREAQARWAEAIGELRKAGGTPEKVRELIVAHQEEAKH